MPGKHPIHITRRDIRFDLTGVDLNDWHSAGPHASHFFNVQSLLFPQGERFFIRSVRHYLPRLANDELRNQVTGFIGQEAAHRREHAEYNTQLAALGYPIAQVERLLARNFALGERLLSPATCLAVTVAFEHLTAIAAEDMLCEDNILDGANPEMARLWRWHAMEETEHKAVAFDVYREVAGSGFMAWLKRCVALLLVSLGMQLSIWTMLLLVSFRTGNMLKLKGWARLFSLLWIKPGLFRRVIPRYLRFFKPSFHPWDVDNYYQVQRWQAEYDKS